MQDKDIDRFEGHEKRKLRNRQRVRLKWELEPPTNIPAGAIGQVTRVSPWDVWVRFEKRVVRLPFSEVEHSETKRPT